MEQPKTQVPEEQQRRESESLEEYLGSFYDTSGLARRYGCSEADVAAMVRDGVLVAVPTDEDDLLYPAFQFTEATVPHPDMVAFVAYLRTRGYEGMDIAMHLRMTANPYAYYTSSQDASSTIALIHGGRVQDAIGFWEQYYKVLDGPSGWY